MAGYRVKRALDVAGSIAALVVGAPILGLVALVVRLVMGAPVLFLQQRPGLGGRPFILAKFRTMREAAPGTEGADAERLTPLGKFLRATSLDELPELWNVLKGDMSLVGPRPLLMKYLERYSPEQCRRHEVRPGITGWAQVNGRNRLGWDQKLALDVWYVDHISLRLDLRILMMTVLSLFRFRDVSAPGEATAPEFSGTTPSDGSRREAGA